MKLKIIAGAVSVLLATATQAHHSFAPHFDANKPVSITGVITEFEQRNPHAYLHVRAEDADGRTVEWECESHGVTQLTRNGLSADMFAVGSTIQIDGSAVTAFLSAIAAIPRSVFLIRFILPMAES